MRNRNRGVTITLVIASLLGAIGISTSVRNGHKVEKPKCTTVQGHIERNEGGHTGHTISLEEITDHVFLGGHVNVSRVSVDTIRVLNAGEGRFVELCVEPHTGGLEAYRSIVSGRLLPEPTAVP